MASRNSSSRRGKLRSALIGATLYRAVLVLLLNRQPTGRARLIGSLELDCVGVILHWILAEIGQWFVLRIDWYSCL